MTREELIAKGILPQWIDEITISLHDLVCETNNLHDYIYENAFQEAESDHPSPMYSVDYEIQKTDGKYIEMLVWVEGSEM